VRASAGFGAAGAAAAARRPAVAAASRGVLHAGGSGWRPATGMDMWIPTRQRGSYIYPTTIYARQAYIRLQLVPYKASHARLYNWI